MMRITQYRSLLDDNGCPQLHEEKTVDHKDCSFCDPESIVRMMNDVFQLDMNTEEFLYELCFNSDMGLVGVFEISHGTINCTAANPREIFQKALLCGAASVILMHNHPSGNEMPSDTDRHFAERIKQAGELMGIPILDALVVGRYGRYFSFRKNGLIADARRLCDDEKE